MNKIEFLTELKMELEGLPPADVDAAVDYYNEIIDESIDAGLSPVAAVALLPTPAELAEKILATEVPHPRNGVVHNRRESMYEPPKRAPMRKRRAWEWCLLILAIPILLILTVAALVLLLAASLVGFVLLIALYILDLGLALLSLLGVFVVVLSSVIYSNLPLSLCLVGITLLSLGLSLLLFSGSRALTVQILRMNRYIFHRGRAKFHERRTTV